jgi:hypothetical protein
LSFAARIFATTVSTLAIGENLLSRCENGVVNLAIPR